jgi:hypothetical protein
MGAMALHGYSSMELKSRSFKSKEPHVAREPQVADPWSRRKPGSGTPLLFSSFYTGYFAIYRYIHNFMEIKPLRRI